MFVASTGIQNWDAKEFKDKRGKFSRGKNEGEKGETTDKLDLGNSIS